MIDINQNEAMRLIFYEAACSTAITAWKIQTDFEPLKYKRGKQLLRLHENAKD